MNRPRLGMTAAQGWALGLTSVASLMVAVDALVVTTALPVIRVHLHASLARPGRWALGDRADELVDERLRQAPPDDRTQRHHRRLLPLPRCRTGRHPPDHPARPQPLPVGHTPYHQTTEMTSIAGRS